MSEGTKKMDESTMLLVVIAETLGGWFGFLGIGYLIAGVTEKKGSLVTTGFTLMVCWWLAVAVMAAATTVTAGCGAPLWLVVQLVVPLVSGSYLMKKCKEEQQ